MTDLTAAASLDVSSSPAKTAPKVAKLSTLAFRALERKLFAGPKTAAVDLGCAPYFILQPMLRRASPLHLMQIELYNEHLVEDTVELWKVHVQREWPALTVDYDEEKLKRKNWRKLYHKQHAAQEAKIASIGAKMRSRYNELSAEKEKKKIVLVEKVFAPKCGRPRGAWGSSISGGSVGHKGSRVVTKVRAELKRSAALFRHPEAPVSRRLLGISHKMDADSRKLPSLPVTPESGIRMTTSNCLDTPYTAPVNNSLANVSGGGLPQRRAKPLADDDGDLGGVSKEETRRLLDAMTWNPSATKSKPSSPQNVPKSKPKVAEPVSLFIPKRKTNVEAQTPGKSKNFGSRNLAAPAASTSNQSTPFKRKPELMGTDRSFKRQK